MNDNDNLAKAYDTAAAPVLPALKRPALTVIVTPPQEYGPFLTISQRQYVAQVQMKRDVEKMNPYDAWCRLNLGV